MFPIPWYAILLISIPQTVLVIKLGFELFGIKVGFKAALLVALMAGLATFFLRQSHIIPGLHTVMLIIIVATLVTSFMHVHIWHSLVASLLGFMILGVIEGLWLPVLLSLTSNTVQDLILNPWLNIIGFQPVTLIALCFYIIVIKRKLTIFKLGDEGV